MEHTTITLPARGSAIAESMPASSVGAEQTRPRITISCFLLAIYGILPICLLAMIFDYFFWGKSLFSALPTSPEYMFFFQLAFGTPHIIASFVILATNGVYLRTYWLRIVPFTLVIFVFFGVGSRFNPLRSVFRHCGRSDGSACDQAADRNLPRHVPAVGMALRRLGVDADLVRIDPVLRGVHERRVFRRDQCLGARNCYWKLAVVLVLTVCCHLRIASGKGRLCLWANAVMVLQSGLFYAEGYSFLAILGPRLVHDLTVFTFYVAHDVNRHGATPQNLLYRLASKLRLGIYWVCPVVALGLTYLIGRYMDPVAQMVTRAVVFYIASPIPRVSSSWATWGYCTTTPKPLRGGKVRLTASMLSWRHKTSSASR